ncbi:hypothetical protein ACLMJK_003601 [Lecanora helva]
MTPGLDARLGNRRGVSVESFRDALNILCRQVKGHAPLSRPRFGTQSSMWSWPGSLRSVALAISGGVDSMALAKLCALLREDPFVRQTYRFRFKAFIVDHRAREGSREEASMVQKSLIDMDFEKQARRLRYQALGIACRAEHIPRLLLAHHADDQAETVLMRLASGQKGVGLKGMRGFAPIPHCHGMHGIAESGCYDRAVAQVEEISRRSKENFKINLMSHNHRTSYQIAAIPPVFEANGVFIWRPLLKYCKQNLIDTCKAHGVAWVEDETNKEVWRTRRNTVRSLLNSSRLPSALSKGSILYLSARMNSKQLSHTKAASDLLRQCHLMLFDVRSGSIVIRLPRQIGDKFISHAYHNKPSASKPLIASLLVRRLAEIVTPYESIPLGSLRFAASILLPESVLQEADVSNEGLHDKKFTAAGVQFERLDLTLEAPSPDAEARQQDSRDLNPDHVWSLTRQPFTALRATNMAQEANGTSAHTCIFKTECSSSADISESSVWSPWQLWDGRYWLRIFNRSKDSVQVRPFCEADLQALRAALPKAQLKLLEDVLAAAAPGKVRWTLPVISHFVKTQDDETSNILGLPTLGKAGVLNAKDENDERAVEWQVRYKAVHLGTKSYEGILKNKNFVTSWEDS